MLLLPSLACGLLGDGEAALTRQEEFAQRSCACPHLECVKKVQTEQVAWAKEHGDELIAAGVADSERLQAAADKTAACVERIAKKATSGSPRSAGKRGKRKKR